MASSIPNLNTLRRGGPRLRGRRGPPTLPGEELSEAHNKNQHDRIVQNTDQDASSSRLSSIELGYLVDEYAQFFSTSTEPRARRFPIINRGTYVRTTAIDRLVNAFLKSDPGSRKQIISLGAGSDTRFFRLCSSESHVTYHELDFEANILAKQAAIDRSPVLAERLRALRASGSTHHLHSIDLRSLSPESEHMLPELQTGVPTIILSECCLCYLLPDEATNVISYFHGKLESSTGIVLYEPIRPFDAFGKTMVTNLASRGIQLQTIKRYASLDAQRQRLRSSGFEDSQGARDIFSIWQSHDWTSAAEHDRIDKLEWLDEVEEWKLLASHYCIAWASRGSDVTNAWLVIDGKSTSSEAEQDSNPR